MASGLVIVACKAQWRDWGLRCGLVLCLAGGEVAGGEIGPPPSAWAVEFPFVSHAGTFIACMREARVFFRWLTDGNAPLRTVIGISGGAFSKSAMGEAVMKASNFWMLGVIMGLAVSPVHGISGARGGLGDGSPVVSMSNSGAATAGSSMAPRVSSLSEGFNDITTLVGNGWFQQNLGPSQGAIPNWIQGYAVDFPSHQGDPAAYIAASFSSITGSGTISNWLMTPELDFGGNASLTFWTRGANSSTYPDRLEVRLSTNGTSTNAGSSPTSVGDFSTVLLSINPDLVSGGYPAAWTQFTITNADGLPRSGSGRIAFRHFVTNSGPGGTNGNYIGIDTLSYSIGPAQYQVGVTVVGLEGTGLALSLNGGVPVMPAADGSFLFPAYLDAGASYAVSLTSLPHHPKQTCSASPASGTIGAGDVSVTVTCVTDPFVLSVFSGDGQEVPIHEPFLTELVVSLVDGAGDPVADADITFEAPTSGASAWLYDLTVGPLTTLITQTSASGEATVYAVANGEGGCYGVTASHPHANAVGWQLGNIWYAAIFSDGFELPPAKRYGVSVCVPE